MKPLKRLVVHVFIALTLTTEAVGATFPDAVRCSYVWLAVKSSGQSLGRIDLYNYGIERMAWYAGYIRAQEGNAAFASYVMQTAEQFIVMGAKMSYALDEGWKTGNRPLYNSVVKEAVGCDQKLEVRPVTTFISQW